MYDFVYRTYKIKLFFKLVTMHLPYKTNDILYLEVLRDLFNGGINVNVVK